MKKRKPHPVPITDRSGSGWGFENPKNKPSDWSRWRERQLELDRQHESQFREGGRKLPVRYDE